MITILKQLCGVNRGLKSEMPNLFSPKLQLSVVCRRQMPGKSCSHIPFEELIDGSFCSFCIGKFEDIFFCFESTLKCNAHTLMFWLNAEYVVDAY